MRRENVHYHTAPGGDATAINAGLLASPIRNCTNWWVKGEWTSENGKLTDHIYRPYERNRTCPGRLYPLATSSGTCSVTENNPCKAACCSFLSMPSMDNQNKINYKAHLCCRRNRYHLRLLPLHLGIPGGSSRCRGQPRPAIGQSNMYITERGLRK